MQLVLNRSIVENIGWRSRLLDSTDFLESEEHTRLKPNKLLFFIFHPVNL